MIKVESKNTFVLEHSFDAEITTIFQINGNISVFENKK